MADSGSLLVTSLG